MTSIVALPSPSTEMTSQPTTVRASIEIDSLPNTSEAISASIVWWIS